MTDVCSFLSVVFFSTWKWKIVEEQFPTVFNWPHGGENVYITGSFNNWKTRIPLNKSGSDFSTILYLPPGEHRYKFIVDDDWSYSPEQPTVSDLLGNISNKVDVEQAVSNEMESLAADLDMDEEDSDDDDGYSQEVPSLWEGGTPMSGQLTLLYSKDPPHLPPHLFRSVLDGISTSKDPTVLPTPHHVMINHLYQSRQNTPDVLVFGQTHRYKKKFVTTIFFGPTNQDLDQFKQGLSKEEEEQQPEKQKGTEEIKEQKKEEEEELDGEGGIVEMASTPLSYVSSALGFGGREKSGKE
eukprot:TRINITY_DN2648_c0_g1_i1.p1 TRINITY_DN2648_c0_g1~~TRINITY_DN2648_c0_g1_i1.p1  ORF type:complete len:297 (-),score=81.50 TRINITY_DN2648_c0_g1_i1:264-1154(-)